MYTHIVSAVAWERLASAGDKVRERLHLATEALTAARVPYAIAGDFAVAAWVSEVDEAATRTTQDVDVLLRRSDFESAKAALVGAGFVHRHSSGIDMFLDGAGAKARDGVHVVFAGERVRPGYAFAAPDIGESRPAATFHVLGLEALVRMKLTSCRDKDRTHLRDLIDVGLVDRSWTDRLPAELAGRLQQLLDSPDG